MYTIGEFSRMTNLTVKALRFYHEQGILIPEKISYENSYRLYGEESFERAVRINQLKSVGFSLNEIKTIFAECTEEQDITRFLQTKRKETRQKIESYKEIETRLKNWEKMIRSKKMKENYDIKELNINEMTIAAVKMKGKYSEIGEGFSLLFKKAGRWITGKSFALYHDMEYKEKDADFEACFPVKNKFDADGIDCRILPSTKVVSLLYKGPYGAQGDSYARLFAYCQKNNLTPKAPIREIYHKGPGMLFKGNPDKYLTELQIPVSGE